METIDPIERLARARESLQLVADGRDTLPLPDQLKLIGDALGQTLDALQKVFTK